MTQAFTAAIRENYAAVATTYDGPWADVLAVQPGLEPEDFTESGTVLYTTAR